MGAKSELMGSLYYRHGVVHVSQLEGGLWYAQYRHEGGDGPRMAGMTALRAVNSVREYHNLFKQERLTGRRSFQLLDRRNAHYKKMRLIKRAAAEAAGSAVVVQGKGPQVSESGPSLGVFP